MCVSSHAHRVLWMIGMSVYWRCYERFLFVFQNYRNNLKIRSFSKLLHVWLLLQFCIHKLKVARPIGFRFCCGFFFFFFSFKIQSDICFVAPKFPFFICLLTQVPKFKAFYICILKKTDLVACHLTSLLSVRFRVQRRWRSDPERLVCHCEKNPHHWCQVRLDQQDAQHVSIVLFFVFLLCVWISTTDQVSTMYFNMHL